MSKKISFKGTLPVGEQDLIRLKTINGKRGYKITKFQLMGEEPGKNLSMEYLGKITLTDQTGNINEFVKFTDSDLLAAAHLFYSGNTNPTSEIVIFDNITFNQDIFVNITTTDGTTVACNYYIELETMALTDLETTKMTLQSIRRITS